MYKTVQTSEALKKSQPGGIKEGVKTKFL